VIFWEGVRRQRPTDGRERKKKGGDKIEERERERVECTQVLMLGRNKFKCV